MSRGAKGAREKALQFLREVPRISINNIKSAPRANQNIIVKKRGRGQSGKEHGWGASARQKLYFGPLGYESGSTPIQRQVTYERSYNYGIHSQRQYPEISLSKIQLMIDTGRLDAQAPIDLAALCGTKVLYLKPDQNQFGFNLTSEGMDTFDAKVNIEVQFASEQAIAAVERAGGRITTAYYDLHSVIAAINPIKFFLSGAPIPKRLTPPQQLMRYFISASNRGYLADPSLVAEDRLVLAQKYGYELDEDENPPSFMQETKDPRQIFYGLEPGWIVNLPEGIIYKPTDPGLEEHYNN